MPSSGPEGEQQGLQARSCPCYPGGPLADTQTPPPHTPLVLQRSSTKCRSRSRGAAKATRCRLPVRPWRAQPRCRRRSARAVWPSELAGHPGKPLGTPTAPGHASGIALGLPPCRLVWPLAQAGVTQPAVPPLSWCSGDQQPGQWPNSAINSEKHQCQELFSVCLIFARPQLASPLSCTDLPAPLDPWCRGLRYPQSTAEKGARRFWPGSCQ